MIFPHSLTSYSYKISQEETRINHHLINMISNQIKSVSRNTEINSLVPMGKNYTGFHGYGQPRALKIIWPFLLSREIKTCSENRIQALANPSHCLRIRMWSSVGLISKPRSATDECNLFVPVYALHYFKYFNFKMYVLLRSKMKNHTVLSLLWGTIWHSIAATWPGLCILA